MRSPTIRIVLCFSLFVGMTACGGGPKAVRGRDVEGLDDPAMSTRLDRSDLKHMLDENLDLLLNSGAVRHWQQQNRPTVAVLPIRNETSEHIDSALQALISDIETQLINSGYVRVISVENQPRLIEEVRRQYSDAFDKSEVADWGKQLGAEYFVTGKVFTTDERMSGARRVQYYMFMQVLNAETSEIIFQNKTSVTKALVND